MKGMKLLLTVFALTMLASCSETHFKEDKIFAGGVYVTAKQLNDGKSLYTEYCMACHGVNGDGKGVASKGLTVPPRDFKLGQYKFGRVVSGELPHDEDFYEIFKKGLHGTAMLPWDLKPQQMFNVTQYIKTFAPDVWEGTDKTLGEVIKVGKDPYGLALKDSAIKRGSEVYHVVAQCWTCHRAYEPEKEFAAMYKKINNENIRELDPDMYKIKLQPSDYEVATIPPDFTYDEVRSAVTVEELYLRINAGVGGTAMASWKGVLQDDEIWAVSYYIKSLMDMKRTPARTELLNKIQATKK